MPGEITLTREQFDKLLAAATRTAPHVCPPCARAHYPHLYPSWWYAQTQPYYGTTLTNGTTTQGKDISIK